jgi:hypothetical protein
MCIVCIRLGGTLIIRGIGNMILKLSIFVVGSMR